MEYTDFFSQYQNRLKKTKNIFESIDKQNKQVVSELFGLKFKGSGQKKKDALEDYFFQLMKAPAWQSYKIKVSENGTEILIKDSDVDDQYDAWDIIAKEAKKDNYNGAIKQDGDTVIYSEKDRNSKSQDDEDLEGEEESGKGESEDESVEEQTSYNLVYDKKIGAYLFGSKERVVKKISNAQSEIVSYNWQKSPLKYLFENPLKFKLEEISFDFKNNSIIAAKEGFWIGDFSGKWFTADFVGNNFKGHFYNNNSSWKSKPTAFLDGKFTDTSKTGILGLNDVKKSNESYNFNIIQLPENYSIEILTNKQLRHTITCEKRLDNINSSFKYSVYMGYDIENQDSKSVTLNWAEMRTKYDSYVVGAKMKTLPGLFSLESDESIVELQVVEAGVSPYFKKKESFDDSKEYVENTSNLKGIKKLSGSQYNTNLKFNITNDSDLDNFNKIKSYINSPKFENDLNQISIYLENNLISPQDIRSKFPYLVNIFTSDILKEAAVNFGARSSYGSLKPSVGGTLGIKNPDTGKKFEYAYEIAAYLDNKYKKQIEANSGRRPNSYNREYEDLVKRAGLGLGSRNQGSAQNKNISTEPTTAEKIGTSKEEDAVLKRVENFVKYFVYKIQDGNNTNKIRKYFIDLLKNKFRAKVKPMNRASVTPTSVTTTIQNPPLKNTQVPPVQKTTTQNKKKKPSTTPKAGGIKPISENIIRTEIRKYFKGIL